MREIKFRVWNNTGKRMLYDSSLAFKANKVIEELGTKVMQYTGLKDKNNKEIYEGDVLKIGDTIYQIYWDDRFVEWGLTGISQSLGLMFNKENDDKEVIGNIYENPELLNKPPYPSSKEQD